MKAPGKPAPKRPAKPPKKVAAPPAPAPAGYSGTPLAKKLGYKEGTRALLLHAPDHYHALLHPLPAVVVFQSKPGPDIDLAHVFVTEKEVLVRHLATLREKLRPDAALWISWPKKSAKVPTTITEEVIRDFALPLGWVDIKVCAVDEIWSGLKLVVRTTLR